MCLYSSSHRFMYSIQRNLQHMHVIPEDFSSDLQSWSSGPNVLDLRYTFEWCLLELRKRFGYTFNTNYMRSRVHVQPPIEEESAVDAFTIIISCLVGKMSFVLISYCL